ncbi:hypothetical protein [Agaribacterium sp. ZY112]|uniref:hypothetical protein n=1 Tax=Agaribacterium sp. ZY112 TaxID=3233574 RepID=UPI003524D4E5
MDITALPNFGVLNAIFTTNNMSVLAIGLLYLVLSMYRHFQLKKNRKVDFTKEKMEFISTFFSTKDNMGNESFKETAYSYLYDCDLASYEIDYFDRYPNSIHMYRDYITSRRYIYFPPNADHPELKTNMPPLEKQINSRKRLTFFFIAMMALPLTIYTSPLDFDAAKNIRFLFASSAIITVSIIGIFITFIDTLQLDAAKRLENAISVFKKNGEGKETEPEFVTNMVQTSEQN